MPTKTHWKSILIVTAVLVLAGSGLLLWWNVFDDPALAGQLRQLGGSLPEELDGFEKAEGVIPLPFPETFGAHLGYLTEWWYYTGNLETQEGRHFGYQLTFFRQALQPPGVIPEGGSDWRSEQLYFAHFTLTDVAAEQFTFRERFSRAGAGLAGAQAQPYRVWLEDWQVRQIGDRQYQLSARMENLSLSLTLEDEKGPVLQGKEGYSQKGPEPGNASYYYSQPRLKSSGTVQLGDEFYEVSGWSWKDHEFSTSGLSDNQVGWDWFSLQLDDGTDLMLYTFRNADGSIGAYSSGVIISPEGTLSPLSLEDFSITALDRWVSPDSGAEYPAKWRIEVPAAGIDLTVTPYISDQELLVTVIYWEGAVKVTGTYGGKAVQGNGYVELTGYARSMQSWL